MDIPKLSMALSQTKIMTQVNMSLIKLAKEQTEQAGDQLAKMISETSVIDIKI